MPLLVFSIIHLTHDDLARPSRRIRAPRPARLPRLCAFAHATGDDGLEVAQTGAEGAQKQGEQTPSRRYAPSASHSPLPTVLLPSPPTQQTAVSTPCTRPTPNAHPSHSPCTAVPVPAHRHPVPSVYLSAPAARQPHSHTQHTAPYVRARTAIRLRYQQTPMRALACASGLPDQQASPPRTIHTRACCQPPACLGVALPMPWTACGVADVEALRVVRAAHPSSTTRGIRMRRPRHCRRRRLSRPPLSSISPALMPYFDAAAPAVSPSPPHGLIPWPFSHRFRTPTV
ncbi:hypothetical protein PLICRDRAFT_180339 [Plicaturopsis crispa FD-325 SS-3]|uniref:Uncharacterized protein n=1 Tax=Plicaturopsis crispa FD-325 SS-3 TaxID=944288 RepID=A0A0C9SKD9_PLICR|nr:hypothetical protein PLICRDRAFT_180339 [Plicaturopsis crispa FD-325 SS-3]